MQEVRQQHQIVAGSIIDIERAAGFGLITIGNAGSLRILFGDFQDVRPIDRGDFDLRILFGERDAVQPVTGGDVEHAQLPVFRRIDELGHQLRRHGHHRRHRARESHPHRMIGFQRRVADAATVAHSLSQAIEIVLDVRRQDEFADRAHVCRRAFVEERRRVERQRVFVALLG